MNTPLPPAGYLAPPTPDHCRSMLDDWVVESMPLSSATAQKVLTGHERRMRVKHVERTLKSLVGLDKPVTSFRSPGFVKNEYERIWTSYDWPSSDASANGHRPTLARWADEFLVLRNGALDRMELDRICAAIEHLRPRSMLEVGCGVGRNLLVLSAMYPDIRFAGLELSDAGIATARSVQAEDRLPDVLATFCPRQVKDVTAHKRIAFTQGNARDLPFGDGSFDVVFSRLALEQMDPIKDEVLAGMRRVVSDAAVFAEPFVDCNASGLQDLMRRAKNYFSLSVAGLADYGFAPEACFFDWPHKIKQCTGLVVARPV